MRERLGIYIHIPFCASKCSYCDFYSCAGADRLMPEYQKALLRHLEESARSIKHYEVDSVYFGGGTPSYYGADRIVEIFNELKLNGNVRVDAEVTVECNPDSTSYAALRLLREEGVNRISFGMQETNNDLLKLIGRRHSYRQAVDAFEAARRAGFGNISLDLMYGLPSQSKNDWAETLSKAVALHPEHISCYGLKLEEGTRMYREYKDSPLLPDDDEQADMYSYAVAFLARYGYKQYEISNFAVPGFESKHNLKYWNLDDYIGFGPGAHSCVRNLRYSFGKDLKEYIQGIERGRSLVDEYEEITPLEHAVEYLMLAMRTSEGISERDYKRKCGYEWSPVYKALLVFKEHGWVERTGERWHFTVPGFLVSNQLIGILLEAQANGRRASMPGVQPGLTDDTDNLTASLPKSEEEKFRELYTKGFKQT